MIINLTAEDRSDLVRWISSGVFVLLIHGGVAVALVEWGEPVGDFGAPGTVITMDLMPVPVTSEAEQTDIPPGPEQVQAEAPPDKPEEKVEEKIEEEVPVAPDPEVAIATPQPQPQPDQPVEPPQLTAPTTTAPQAARTNNANAVPNWKAQVVGLLERNKRYPSEARAHPARAREGRNLWGERALPERVAWRLRHGGGPHGSDVRRPSCAVRQLSWTCDFL